MVEALRRLQRTQVLLIFTGGLLPVIHSTLVGRPFRTPQIALLILVLGALIGLGATGSGAWIKKEAAPVKVALAAFGLLFVWLSISTVVGLDPVRSLSGDAFQSTGLVFWAVVIALYVAALRFRSGLAGPLTNALLLSGAFMLFLTVLWFVDRQFFVDVVPTALEGAPLPGLGNVAYVAPFCVVVGLLAIGRAIDGGRVWLRWVLLAGALQILAVIVHPRGAIAESIVAVAGGLFFSLRRGRPVRRVAVVLTALAFATVASVTWVVPRLPELSYRGLKAWRPVEAPRRAEERRLGSEQIGGAVGSRLVFWRIASNSQGEHPVFGVGPANFIYTYRQHVAGEDLGRLPEPDMQIQDAHNFVVELGSTGGIPAAVLAMVGVIAAGMSFVGGGPENPPKTWLRLGAGVFLLLHLFEPFSLVITPLLAILAGASAKGSAVSVPAGGSANGPKRLVVAVAVVLGATVAGAVLYSDFLWRAGSLEWNRNDLARAVALDPTCVPCLNDLGKVRAWDHSRDGIGTLAWTLRPYHQAIERHRYDSEPNLRLGGSLLFLGMPEDAVGPLTQARRLEPYSSMAAQALAVAYLRTGRPADAVSLIQYVVDVAPTALAYGLLADAAEQAGLPELAEEARARAIKLDPSGFSLRSPGHP